MEKAKKSRGRPPKSAEELRSEVLYLKLTPPEKAVISQAGGENPTVWARETLLRAARRKKWALAD